MSSLRMIDESAFQTTYWTSAALRVNRIQVVAIKVTEGLGWYSSYYTWQLQQARLAGCAVMHYHLAHPETNSAKAEADYFFSKVKAAPGDLIALDVEPQIFGTIPATAGSSWAGQFSADVHTKFGVLPVIYSAGSTIGDGGLESVRGKNPLWYADPGASPSSPPAPPMPWLISFLQYSTNPRWSSGGTDVDAAYFGSLSQLAELAIPPAKTTVTVTVKDKVTGEVATKTLKYSVSWI